MKIKQLVSFAVIACMILVLVGCSKEAPTILELDDPHSTAATEIDPTPDSTSNRDDCSETSSGVTIEFSEETKDLVEGTLLFTIVNATIVTHEDNIPLEGGTFSDCAIWQIQNDEVVEYRYPNFINADGSFLEDSCLVLVEVVVESQNATARTDVENGALYDNPYIFRADRLTLADLTRKDRGGYYIVEELDYFSGLNSCVEHPFAYQLKPGEVKTFTLGWFIGGHKHDGSLTDFSNLCLCDTYGNRDSTLVKLGLGG